MDIKLDEIKQAFKMATSAPVIVEWSAHFELGIPEIDNQHKQMVEFINQLYDARFNQDKNGIVRVLSRLEEYTLLHLTYEENLMKAANYKNYIAHKASHDHLVETVMKFRNKLSLGDENVVVELQNLMFTWFTKHILHDDAEYRDEILAYLKTK